MAKKKKTIETENELLSELINHPHDKYFKIVLQNKEMAVQLIKYCVPKDVLDQIDLDTLEITDESFVDKHMQEHFTDICYTALSKDGKEVRITIIFEHKSWLPKKGAITEQLNRYIVNTWGNDLQQDRTLSLVVPILVTHGGFSMAKETVELLFPDTPDCLIKYIPRFDYILLDLNNVPDETINNINYMLLQKFFLALKHARNIIFIEQNWKEFLIFAPTFPDQALLARVYSATILYLGRVSDNFNQKLKNMDTLLTTTEKEQTLPYVLQLYKEWLEKGLEQGLEQGMIKPISTFMKKNPSLTNEQIADIFDVSVEMVKEIREKLK
jgi:predicted transposase/invertase (TIGR01784 family)